MITSCVRHFQAIDHSSTTPVPPSSTLHPPPCRLTNINTATQHNNHTPQKHCKASCAPFPPTSQLSPWRQTNKHPPVPPLLAVQWPTRSTHRWVCVMSHAIIQTPTSPPPHLQHNCWVMRKWQQQQRELAACAKETKDEGLV